MGTLTPRKIWLDFRRFLFSKSRRISNSARFLAMVGIPTPGEIWYGRNLGGTYSIRPTKFPTQPNFLASVGILNSERKLRTPNIQQNLVELEFRRGLNKTHQFPNSTKFLVLGSPPTPRIVSGWKFGGSYRVCPALIPTRPNFVGRRDSRRRRKFGWVGNSAGLIA